MDALRLQKEMEELNRRIAEEKNQIVGIIKKSDIGEAEIKKTLPTSLIGIALPSNLKDILKSINIVGSASKVETPISEDVTMIDEDEEYVPECPSSSLLGYKSAGFSYTATSTSTVDTPPKDSTSKLATLTEEELLRMVPDDAKVSFTIKKLLGHFFGLVFSKPMFPLFWNSVCCPLSIDTASLHQLMLRSGRILKITCITRDYPKVLDF